MNPSDNVVILECTTSIISAYVSNNTIQKENLPVLIMDTFKSLAQVDRAAAPVEDLKPAVPIKRSVQPDHIICLEDGKKFKSLKRHLMSHYNMTPQDYREKWGLPSDYPMVAPNYALARSNLAKRMGLGQRLTRTATAKPAKTSVKPSKKAPAAKKNASRKTAAATP
jgi:MucR family transcriptional regulator, transcriptional regulator of exopolysaccharide biosynthesis